MKLAVKGIEDTGVRLVQLAKKNSVVAAVFNILLSELLYAYIVLVLPLASLFQVKQRRLSIRKDMAGDMLSSLLYCVPLYISSHD